MSVAKTTPRITGSHLVANVTEPGDIALYVTAVLVILVVGLALLGMDTVLERLDRRRRRKAGARRSLWSSTDSGGDRPAQDVHG